MGMTQVFISYSCKFISLSCTGVPLWMITTVLLLPEGGATRKLQLEHGLSLCAPRGRKESLPYTGVKN